MRTSYVALGLVLLMVGIAAVFAARDRDDSDDAAEPIRGLHRVEIGEIELQIPNTVEFYVPGERVIHPGDPLFSGSLSERYLKIPLNQILSGPSWNARIFIGGLTSPKIDLYCQYIEELENNRNKWHRRVDSDGVILYDYISKNRPNLGPEDLGDYLKLDSKILNRTIIIEKSPVRIKSGSGKDFGHSYRIKMKITSSLNLEIHFTDADIPRPTWPEAFATIDKTLSQWIRRSDASDSEPPQPFRADDCDTKPQ